MSNSIRRIIDATTRAYDAEIDALEDADVYDKVARAVSVMVGVLSEYEWRYLRDVKEEDQ